MRVLVFGAGVIGSYTAHVLCMAGNDVTILARGKREKNLKEKGLVIKHHKRHKMTVDYPYIIGNLEEDDIYDIIFVVMQYGQMWDTLPMLASNNSPMIVLVGNNMATVQMERYLTEHSTNMKTIVFGFQATGGKRNKDMIEAVYLHPGMNLGSTSTDKEWKKIIQKSFEGTAYTLTFHDDMDAWCKCHLAFILPICYLCYALDCNLKKATAKQINEIIDATIEGYELLEYLHYPMVPADLKEYFIKKRRSAFFMLWVLAKTKLGVLAASEHAKNAVGEMIVLNKEFDKLKEQATDFSMPVWDRLERFMPKQ